MSVLQRLEAIASGLDAPEMVDPPEYPNRIDLVANSGALTRASAAAELRRLVRDILETHLVVLPRWEVVSTAIQRVRLVVPTEEGEAALAQFQQAGGWRSVQALPVASKVRGLNGARTIDGSRVQIIAERPLGVPVK